MVACRADDDVVTLGDGAQLKRMANCGWQEGCSLPHCSPLDHGISFSVRKLACPFLPTMMWSCTNIPSGRRYRRSRGSSAHPPARAKDRRTDDCALKAKFHSGGNCCAARVSCWHETDQQLCPQFGC